MKNVLKTLACLSLIILGSMSVYADNGDEYSSATPGAVSNNIKEVMDKDKANLACNGSLCTLFSVSVNKKNFNITTYVGDGMPAQQSTGNNYYYGNTQASGPSGKLGYGIQVTWENTNCTKNINVDKSIYESVTTYMKELINVTPGEPKTYPQFTPAEQTMILFYTTVMDLTKGSTCN
jgi:hypothetical protein